MHAVRALRKSVAPGLIPVEVGTALPYALHLFERADKVIAVGAAQAGGLPGTIYRFAADAGEWVPEGSLRELARALQSSKSARPETVILGIEPAATGYGMALSPELKRAVPRVVKEIRNLVASWMRTLA
ncbi:MAG: hydrogenase maturation protease [Acidobacteria bacterium]|nr:hydrogenase maturation protease [Acidobacteriota bacterium]